MADQEVHAAPTLTEMMRRRAALTPDAPYFYLYGDTITYGRLWEVSGRYAAGLARGGLRAGDKLCLIYPTCAEFFFTFFGALRIGVVPVPLYPTLGVVATALPRHGAHRLRLHAAAHAHAALALAPGPPQPAPVARALHRGACHVHGLARFRLSELPASRPGHRRARSDEPQGRALRRRDGAAVHHRGLRVTLRPRARHLPLLRARGGDARRGDLAARRAAPVRSEREVPLGGPALPRRRGAGPRPRRRRRSPAGARRGGRDLRAEPRCHARLLQQRGGHAKGALAGRLAPDGRPRLPGQGRIPLRDWPAERSDHPGR